MPRDWASKDFTCSDCGSTFQKRLAKPCSDGLFRCKTCMGKRCRAKQEDRLGTSVYEHCQKGKPGTAETRRAWQLKRSYGMTASDYDRMLASQGGVCFTCSRAPGEDGSGHNHLVIDHDHSTGRVRGLLCHNCNRAIGMLRDDPVIVLNVAEYLHCHREAG